MQAYRVKVLLLPNIAHLRDEPFLHDPLLFFCLILSQFPLKKIFLTLWKNQMDGQTAGTWWDKVLSCLWGVRLKDRWGVGREGRQVKARDFDSRSFLRTRIFGGECLIMIQIQNTWYKIKVHKNIHPAKSVFLSVWTKLSVSGVSW